MTAPAGPRWRPRSFRGQLVLSTMALTALGLLVVTLSLQVVVHRVVEGNVRRVLEDRAESVVAAVAAESRGAELSVPRTVLDPGVVVFDADGRRRAGTTSARVQGQVARLGTVDRRTTVRAGEAEQLFAQPFTTRTGASGVVVVSETLTPYEQTERYVGLASALVGLLVVGGVGLITRWVSNRSLAPVAQMAERAQDWSEHDLNHRFGLGPPVNELSALGATLDGLLGRVARTIRAEQRLTAELAHELRTPLTAIQGTADLALLRGGLGDEARLDLEQIARSSREMADTITALLDLARDAAGDASAVCTVAELVAGVAALVPPGRALEDRTGPNHTLRVAAPKDLAVRALAPLVENAARHARSRVTLGVRHSAGAIDVYVADDGPGVDDDVRGRLFSPGATGAGGGTGLGLGIARRVARSLGGEVLLDDDPGVGTATAGSTGAVFVLRLPRP